VVHWLLFAVNDIYVIPVQGGLPNQFPASGFSRYASICGLGGDNIVNPNTCTAFSNLALGKFEHANWSCRQCRLFVKLSAKLTAAYGGLL
jgi:hypothetical protein